MENNTIELSLLDPEEREMLNAIWSIIPEQDRLQLSQDDVLFVLDSMDDFLLDKGLAEEDERTGEITYLDGEVDETEQMQYIMDQIARARRSISAVQVQLIMDAEMQYGLSQGWYSEED
ncbi:MAG: hypothetical protein IJ609_02595 [Paludibacteraceae bacterium]|nr:hypothetical protein [Paludibacteraceae bacterium]MBR1480801.1 hypothetical protein [Paludibacteraceae bacterium]